MAAAPKPEFGWTLIVGITGYVMFRSGEHRALMRVYPDRLTSSWLAEPWSGPPPENAPRFAFLEDAKTYCEVTAKLCAL